MKKSLKDVRIRQEKIVEYLKTNKSCTVKDLEALLNVSLPTIRRDLDYLYSNNIIERYYGGAALLSVPGSDVLQNPLELSKNSIAKQAASMINDHDIVFINSSSTALSILKYLEDKHVTIITNNANAIHYDSSPNVQIILTGGELRVPKHALVGDVAIDTLNKITANKCVLGCNGISAEAGLTTKNISEVTVNELMISKTIETKIVVCDSAKIGIASNFKAVGIESIDYIITNKGSNESELELIQDKFVKVIQLDC